VETQGDVKIDMKNLAHRANRRDAAKFLLAASLATCTLSLLAAAPAYHAAETLRLSGDVRWDYLSVDAASHHLFLTRGDHVDVFDTITKHVMGVIPDTHGVHGVAAAPELNRGFTSNGMDSTVTVFALDTLKVLATVATGERPDAIVYDPFTKRVFTANAKSQNLTAIDATNEKVVGSVALPGKPETAVVDGAGKLFVNIEDKNQVMAVDTQKLAVSGTFDVAAACDEPAGLAIDVMARRLFATCHNGKMAVIDADSGKVVATVPIGRSTDAAAFDSGTGLAFSSNGDGTLTVVGKDGSGRYAVAQTVTTMRGARTMALDPATHIVYLVAAEYDINPPPADAAAKQPARARLKPGTFTLLIVAP
jgi:DNA-binding beta-propeller fold protein YncE